MAEEPIDELWRHLAATEELPVEATASRWLGEAQAAAADARGAPDAVVEKRAAQVLDLLEHVDGTGHPEADEHVAAARSVAEDIRG